MFCGKCGKKIEGNFNNCPYCGNAIESNFINNQNNGFNDFSNNNQYSENNSYFNNNQINNNQMNNYDTNQYIALNNATKKIKKFNLKEFLLTNWKKCTIALLLIIIVGLLLSIFTEGNNDKTRTIMFYVVGSNLETDSRIATEDLASIDPNKIDLKKTNIILYAGGTKKWHNFITNNGLYKLTKNGFELIKEEQPESLGSPETLTKFLKYGYDNYKTDVYDLVLYDHGGAISGAIYDDIFNNNLSLSDMDKALKDSPFNEKNKLETVLFRTCLNGTLEVSNIFKNYSEYLIASEETTYGSPYSPVFGSMNLISSKDTGKEYGIKFINEYNNQMSFTINLGALTSTYSVIDLSKIDKVNELFDEYISSIDLSKNYKNISKIRANVYQYGNEVKGYDMIDLYSFINEVKDYASKSPNSLLKAIKETVIYNSTNEKNSNGISIYFPYNGSKAEKQYFLRIYNQFNFLKKYNEFIKKFNEMQVAPSGFNFNIKLNTLNEYKDENKATTKLTNEQIDTFASAGIYIFQRSKEHKNYYRQVLYSENVTLDENGVLTADYDNDLITLKDTDTGEVYYLYSYYLINGEKKIRAIANNVRLLKSGNDYNNINDLFDWATIYLKENSESGRPEIAAVGKESDNDYIDGTLINIDDYAKYAIYLLEYEILDDGEVMPIEDWISPNEILGVSGDIKELKENLYFSNLDKDNGYEYYLTFEIYDIYGGVSFSKLVRIGE